MSRTNRSSRVPAPGLIAVGCVVVLVFVASSTSTQSRITPPQRSTSANANTDRQHIAKLRANDSPEGSRATLSADQSLNDYEAYRRGDRFYVKIPPADVPRPEAVRGRAFGDVKVQRASDGTVVSFRLQPGASARVEQHGNKLDVVFTMPGARQSTSSSTGEVARNEAGPAPLPDSKRRGAGNNNASPANSSFPLSSRRNGTDRGVTAGPTSSPNASPSPNSLPSPSPSASPQSAAAPLSKGSPAIAQQKASPSATTANQQTAQGNTWANLKQRVRYWILLAQLNPIPVALGAAILLLFIGLLVFQRRRAKLARRVRARGAAKKVGPTVRASAGAAAVKSVKPAEGDVTRAGTGQPPVANERQERVAQVSEEVKKLMAGGDYDESIIAAGDRETRQLVGAELLSALVGRNLQRRERARAAFMKHGYFDDATHDLRIAESPNERGAAARRLSFVHDREATPHLIAALDDPSPDVRRASVEALMDLRDPAALASLNSLMQTENDRKVPRSLIQHAIEACATSSADDSVTVPVPAVSSSTHTASAPLPSQPEIEREVIEI